METAIFAIFCAYPVAGGAGGVVILSAGIPVAWLGLFITYRTGWERISVTTIIVFVAITVSHCSWILLLRCWVLKNIKPANGALSGHPSAFYWVSSSFRCGELLSGRFWEHWSENLSPASQPNRLLNRRSVRLWFLFSAA